jgi:hypothetical protein
LKKKKTPGRYGRPASDMEGVTSGYQINMWPDQSVSFPPRIKQSGTSNNPA